MSLSAMGQIVLSGYGLSVGAFAWDGALYVAWTTQAGMASARALAWRRHDGAEGSEVIAQTLGPFNRVSVLARDDGRVLAAYDEGDAKLSRVFVVVFDRETGAIVTAPQHVADGSHPSLMRLPEDRAGRYHLAYTNRLKGSAYLRESFDWGRTWSGEKPILNARARDGEELHAVVYGPRHVSLVQTGIDGRRMVETGSVTRTRPVTALAFDPVRPNTIVAVEAVTGSFFTDNLRGTVATDGAVVLAPTRTRVGTDDGVAEVARYDVAGTTPTLVTSVATPAGASPGTEMARLDAGDVLTLRDVVPMGLSGGISRIAAGAGHAFATAHRDDTPAGGLAILRLADGVKTLVGDGTRFHAVTVAGSIIATSRQVGSAYYLSLGRLGSNPLAPTFTGDHALPSAASALALALEGEAGFLYAAVADRLCIYRVTTLSAPIRLHASIPLLTAGRVLDMVPTPRGNVVCALGEAGVAAFNPVGETLAQLRVAGIYAPDWKGSTAHALHSIVQPTAKQPYASQRRHFRCTTAGTSGTVEPVWNVSGTIVDGSARWVDVGPTAAYVTAVLLDSARGRIYAASVLGGASGTGGRVHSIQAPGMI